MTDTGETAEFSLKTPSVPVSWIYSLPKEKLIKVLEGMDQDTAGTVDELRKRLSTFLKTNPTQTSSRPTSPTPPTTDPTQRDTTMAVCEKVRKWGLNFDGVGDAISFLERIQELRECCDITGGDLLKALPLLFRGNAILWYRKLRVAGMSVDALVDTGATVSCMSQRLLDQLPKTAIRSVQSSRTKLSLANGDTVESRARTSVQIELGRTTLPISFVIMPKNTYDIILGMDALKQMNIVIDVGKREVRHAMKKDNPSTHLESVAAILTEEQKLDE
ncbi:hypothetical protein QE152_g30861 [Popillia japonica]|uniref:Peptidase A2 domain-containing protein n=1 Tax=Popillia japonica TaxID=7064 RepID=A0AAW1JD68_POPJA